MATDLKATWYQQKSSYQQALSPSLQQKLKPQQTHDTLKALAVRLITLCWDYHLRLLWDSILTPNDLKSTFEHVKSCRIPVLCGMASFAMLLSRVNRQDHLKSWALCSSHPTDRGEWTLPGSVFGLLWTLPFVLEHVVLFSWACWFFFCVRQMLLKVCLVPYLKKGIK